MSQSTLDDELFGEAASEMREDVEGSLAAARSKLPDAAAIWEVEADNTLGVLNGLRSALDVEDAADDLRDAKKWYTMAERADAFEDGDDLAAEIEAVEDVVAEVESAREQVGELTGTIPSLRSSLEDAETAVDEGEAEADLEADGEADGETEAEA